MKAMSRFSRSGCGTTRWREQLIRFAFGGLVTVGTGLVARRFGPEIGGLFLAFPAILPASLTLVKRHEGRGEAREAAAGSRLGAVSLVAFAAAVWLLANRGAALSLIAATIAWAALSVVLWSMVYGRRDRRTRSASKPATAHAARRS